MGTPRAVALDLDGVVRHFDRAAAHAVAARFGVDFGDMAATAFAPDRVARLTTGRLARAEWVAEVGRVLATRHGARGPEAAAAWLADIGQVDPHVLAVVRALRAAGTPVAILTNGTDTIAVELQQLGVDAEFDAVVSTWDIGVAKPEAGAYLAVCTALDVPPEAVWFTDDRRDNVLGARAVGLHAEHFCGVDALRTHLRAHGLLGGGAGPGAAPGSLPK